MECQTRTKVCLSLAIVSMHFVYQISKQKVSTCVLSQIKSIMKEANCPKPNFLSFCHFWTVFAGKNRQKLV